MVFGCRNQARPQYLPLASGIDRQHAEVAARSSEFHVHAPRQRTAAILEHEEAASIHLRTHVHVGRAVTVHEEVFDPVRERDERRQARHVGRGRHADGPLRPNRLRVS
jgi:hypothetical protein